MSLFTNDQWKNICAEFHADKNSRIKLSMTLNEYRQQIDSMKKQLTQHSESIQRLRQELRNKTQSLKDGP